jgi:hypothetical protein
MSTSRKRVFVCSVVSAFVLGMTAAVFVEAQDAAPNANQSSTTSSQSDGSNGNNPSRTTQSHTKSGNRTVDKKTIEVLGPDGQYQPYLTIETEQIQESPTVTRSITRTYNPGPDGHVSLTQITEAETRNSGDNSRTVQTTSNPGYDGNLHVTERRVSTTTKGTDSQQTQTSIFVPGVNGDLAPSMQISEQQKNGADGDIQTKKTTLLPDTNGAWQVFEVREQTEKGGAQNKSKDDRVSRRDFQGNVSTASEVITQEKKSGDQVTSTTQTYSIDAPGTARDQSLRPVQTSTTVQKTEAGRTVTEQKIVQPDPGEPDFNTSMTTTDIVVKGNSGSEETITVTAQNPDGSPSMVSLETKKSDQPQH